MARELTSSEINQLASRSGVRRIAVENFLGTLDPSLNERDHRANLYADAGAYRWNSNTVNAIAKGIHAAYREAGQEYRLTL